MKHRYQDAFRAFCRVRSIELIAGRELFYAHSHIVAEEQAFEVKSLARRALQSFTVPRIPRATLSSSIIYISQQFSRIRIIAFY